MHDGFSSNVSNSRRKRARYRTYIVQAMINGELFEVSDISATGAFILQTPDWFVEGQGLLFDFVIGNPPNEKVLPIEGRVIRVEEDGIAVVYRPPGPAWLKVLQKITSHEV